MAAKKKSGGSRSPKPRAQRHTKGKTARKAATKQGRKSSPSSRHTPTVNPTKPKKRRAKSNKVKEPEEVE